MQTRTLLRRENVNGCVIPGCAKRKPGISRFRFDASHRPGMTVVTLFEIRIRNSNR